MASEKSRRAFRILTAAVIGTVGYKLYKKRNKQKTAATLPASPAEADKYPVPPPASGTLAGRSVHGGEPPAGKSADGMRNVILCKGTIPLGDDERVNSNVLVLGGSGAEKNCRITAPNLLQTDASYVVTDPGGGLLHSYGKYLEHMGYRIKCLNLVNMEQSNHYNPFAYIRSDADIDRLAEACMANANPKERQGDFDRPDSPEYQAQLLFLRALIAYIHYYEAPEARNFSGIAKLIHLGIPDITEWRKSPEQRTPLDDLFEKTAQKDPDGYAVRLYQRLCEQCDSGMRRHWLICLGADLMIFSIDEIKSLTATDDIELDTIGDRKTAVFVVIPTADKSYNMLATILYSQIFRRLEDFAENDAPKTVSVVDANNEVVRTFRPGAAANNATVRKEAEAFLERAKGGRVSYDNDLGLWILKTAEGEPVLWRSCKEEAEKAHALLGAGSVVSNQEQNGKENCLPIRTRFFMDEIAELGRIPNFPTTVATLGKYGASLFLFLHTVSQMRNLYPNEWDCVMDNCDITVYLGGGAEYSSAQYVSSLLDPGTQTQKGVSSLQRKKGSLFCGQVKKPLSVDELRELPAEKCLVYIRPHEGAYIFDKYVLNDHPRWKFCRGFGSYTFDPSKCNALR